MFGKLYRDAYKNLFCTVAYYGLMATDQSPAKVITLYVRVFLEYCHKDRVVIKYSYYKNVRRFHYVS